MTMLAALAAAGLLAPLCAATPAGGDVRIEGNVSYEVGTGRALVRDGAVLRRGGVVVRARSATYDPATGEVFATGGVLLTDDTHVLAADSVRAVLGGGVEAEDVVAFVKGEPVALSQARTLEEARGLGRNRLSFSGAHLSGDLSGRFRLSRARLSLCDCTRGPPSWEVTARDADVVPERRAVLHWAVLRIAPPLLHRSIPVLAVPWLYLPLGERQTGLLLPEFPGVPGSSLVVVQPVFFTLGRSADATIAPMYFFARKNPTLDTGNVRGPGARLEIRWAPAVGTAGEAHAAWVHDLEDETGGAGGDRYAFDVSHAQRFSERTSLRTELRLAGDWAWVRDMTPGFWERKIPYDRSDVLVSHRRDAFVLEAGASYLQPLLPAGIPAKPTGWYGPFGSALDVASRWPQAGLTLLPVGAGPLQISGRAGVARFAPVSGAYDAALRPATDRADARLEVGAPLLVGDVLSLAPYVRGAATAYAFEAERAPRGSAWGVAGAVLGTEVSRVFGEVRHVVSPRLEWRAGTAAAGGELEWPSYDALDRSHAGLLSAGPAGAFQQLRASVATRLDLRGTEILRIEAGQDLNLRSGRAAETFGSATLAAGPLSADVSARLLAFETRAVPARMETDGTVLAGKLDRFSELRAVLAFADRRGDALRAGFLSIGPGGSGVLVAGIDPLFDPRVANVQARASATAGVRVVTGGATLGYDAVLPGRATLVRHCGDSSPVPTDFRTVEGWSVREHVASLAYASRCRCFNLVASIHVDDCGRVSSPRISIDLSQLASAARLH